MKKWKQRIALFLSVILSITSVFTWNSTNRVHAEEAVIKSSAEGFEYRLRTYASGSTDYICTSDTSQVYDNYKDAIKGIAEISRKIMVERKVEKYSIKIPVEIKSDQKMMRLMHTQRISLMMMCGMKHIKKLEIQRKDRD